MNRADTRPAPHVTALRGSASISQPLADAIEMLDEERARRSAAADEMTRDLTTAIVGVEEVTLMQALSGG